MKTVKVSIFGGGVGGLSCATHLLNLSKTSNVKFKIDIYEKKDAIGGMARTYRDTDSGCTQEISWRVFFGFYNNLLGMFSEIPTPKGTVLDNLTPYSHKNMTDTPLPTKDYAFAIYNILYGMTSCDERLRKLDSDGLSWYESLGNLPFSELKSVGPWLGGDMYKNAYNSVIKVGMEMHMYNVYMSKFGKLYNSRNLAYLHIIPNSVDFDGYADYVTTGPTSEAVFDWWKLYLERQGVTFHLNEALESVSIENGVVTSALTTKGQISSDFYVFNLPVDELDRLISKTPYLKSLPIAEDVRYLVDNSLHLQISFQIYFNLPISFGHGDKDIKTNGILVTDSQWELIILSYDNIFDSDVELCGGISPPPRGGLSVTACTTYTNGVYGKPLMKCTYEEMKRDIWAQLVGCSSLQELVYENNGFHLGDPILEIVWWSPLWDTFYYDSTSTLRSSEPKFTNNAGTLIKRPSYMIDGLRNAFISTAYIRETIDIYSMEAAAIAGKKVGDAILSRSTGTRVYNDQYILDRPLLFKPFRAIDSISYKNGGPNVSVWVLLFLVFGLLIFVVWYLYRRFKGK